MRPERESKSDPSGIPNGRTSRLLGCAFLIGVIFNLFDNRPVSHLVSAWMPLPALFFEAAYAVALIAVFARLSRRLRTWRLFLILPYLPGVALGVLLDALIDWHFSINRNLFPLEIIALWILTLPLVAVGLYLGRRWARSSVAPVHA